MGAVITVMFECSVGHCTVNESGCSEWQRLNAGTCALKLSGTTQFIAYVSLMS